MPHYIARVELARFQGREAQRQDYSRLHEAMSSLLFDGSLYGDQLELPSGTFVGSSFEGCEAVGKRLAEAVLQVWPNPKIVLSPIKAYWTYGLTDAAQNGMLAGERRQA